MGRELPPGTRLGEERLASLFRLSRTPVREALTRLISSTVIGRDARGMLRVDAVTPERIFDVYAVRGALEALSCRLAAVAALPVGIVELEHINSQCAEAAAAGDFERMAERNVEFHAAVARASRNEMLVQFLEQIHNWVRRIPSTTLSEPGRAQVAVRQHAELISAIRERDPNRAEENARQHMRDAETIRLAMLSRRQ